jgi:membrane carboxypeptidase/penicillin-binding protein
VKSVTVLAMLIVLAGVCLAVFLKPYKQRAAAMDLSEVSDFPGIAYERLPQHLVHAIVAAEDNRFFDHGGLDMKGICRASLVNLRTQSKAQGASTITQQLARQSFGILEKTMDRKLVEAFLALRIEDHFDKQTILSKYLSLIYFGGGFYGIESAASGYFNKPVEKLSVAEAATLAGIIKAPSMLEPRKYPDRALNARNTVITRMVDEGYLTEEQAATFQASSLLP